VRRPHKWLAVPCNICQHDAILNADSWPRQLLVAARRSWEGWPRRAAETSTMDRLGPAAMACAVAFRWSFLEGVDRPGSSRAGGRARREVSAHQQGGEMRSRRSCTGTVQRLSTPRPAPRGAIRSDRPELAVALPAQLDRPHPRRSGWSVDCGPSLSGEHPTTNLGGGHPDDGDPPRAGAHRPRLYGRQAALRCGESPAPLQLTHVKSPDRAWHYFSMHTGRDAVLASPISRQMIGPAGA
jgi:hypothetical protein